MKFTIERIVLQRMIEQLKVERGVKAKSQMMMCLSACAARVFVEANGVVAGIEALVFEDGTCNVPRMKFLKILRTFHPKQNLTLSANRSGLRIEGFLMEVTGFSSVVAAPGEFQVFPVTDAWVALSETTKTTPLPENRWARSR